jgi:hypothetical protein
MRDSNSDSDSDSKDACSTVASTNEGEKNNVIQALKSSISTVNSIIEIIGLKFKVSPLRIISFFDFNSLEDIKKKTLNEILILLKKKYSSLITKVENELKGKKGSIAFFVLMNSTFEEILDNFINNCKIFVSGLYVVDLTGIFYTLEDMN